MKWRNITQSFYETQLSQSFWPVVSLDDPLTVYRMYVKVAPTSTSWWLIIEYENKINREILYYHNRSGTELLVYKKDRWISPTVLQNITHKSDSSVRMHDVADIFNYFSKNTTDFWFIQQWYDTWSALCVQVLWWVLSLAWGVRQDIWDTVLNLWASLTHNIYIDLTDNIIKSSTSAITGQDKIWLWVVVTWLSTITSITDKRAELSTSQFSPSFFDFSGNFVSIKAGSITANEIADLTIDSYKIANSAITTDKLNDNAVNTDKILDKSVTSNKIVEDPIFNDTIRLPELWSNPPVPVAWELKFFVKELLWVPTAHSIDSDWIVTPLWVNPVITPWSAIMVWPVNWTNWQSLTTISDPSALAASSKVTGFYVNTGNIAGLVVECDVPSNWSVTFKSYNNSGVLQAETSVTFYYSIVY